jgi:hypothetical protein
LYRCGEEFLVSLGLDIGVEQFYIELELFELFSGLGVDLIHLHNLVVFTKNPQIDLDLLDALLMPLLNQLID